MLQFTKNKLYILLIINILLTTGCIIFYPMPAESAVIPTLKGKVVNERTGAPIPFIWVKLTTSGVRWHKCPSMRTPAVRYELTDAHGNYKFDPQYPWAGRFDRNRVGRPIDTDLDGNNDAVQIEDLSSPVCIDSNGQWFIADFGCYSVPYTITAVKPYNFTGRFSTIENIVFNNAQTAFDISLERILYYPEINQTPQPTTQPINTPIPTTTPTPSPRTSLNCTNGPCVQKEIGAFDALGNFNIVTEVESNTKYWLRLTVRGKENITNVTNRNILLNGDYEMNPYNTHWNTFTNGSATFRRSQGFESQNGISVNIANPGTNTQINQNNISLKPNTTYLLEFDFYSPDNNTFDIQIIKNTTPFTNYGLDYRPDYTNTWRRYSTTFNTKNFTTPINDARLLIQFYVGGTYYFDNFSLTEFNHPQEYPSSITINEHLNNTIDTNTQKPQFSFVEPIAQTTFKITRNHLYGNREEDITTIICNPNIDACINPTKKIYTRGQLTSLEIVTDTVSSQDIRYIYLQVIPNTSADRLNNVPVDSTTVASTITYTDLTEILTNINEIIPNINITIISSDKFFQVDGGNVYSQSHVSPSVSSKLSPDKFFITNRPGIVFSAKSADFGRGEVSQLKYLVENYSTIQSNMWYEKLLSENKKNSITISNTNFANFNLGGIYIYENDTNDFIINSTWKNKTIEQPTVIFIQGNLYINEPYQVKKDGIASLLFVVNGNVGFAPNVDRADGIIITNGKIDTSCDLSAGGFQDNQTCPSGNTTNIPLRFEGMLHSLNPTGGFSLDRKGIPGNVPGETFIYRPDFIMATKTSGIQSLTWKEITQ